LKDYRIAVLAPEERHVYDTEPFETFLAREERLELSF
jgi:hypothetical protein